MTNPILHDLSGRFADAVNHGGKALVATTQTLLLLGACLAWLIECGLCNASGWLGTHSYETKGTQ